MHPLNQLLKSNTKWNWGKHWGKHCDNAFAQVKQKLVSNQLLVHYNPKLPLQLATDASPYGVGAVIFHIFENGDERPIAYASRTLTTAEQKYSQIEKEALSIVFGIQKFHQYLYARHFTLLTDHKPLVAIFNPSKAIPPLSAARMQHWALLLAAYTYNICYRPTNLHANADALSRLPISNCTQPAQPIAFLSTYYDCLFNLGQLEPLPVTDKQISLATETDPLLSQVLHYVYKGWPKEVPDVLKPFSNCSCELKVF